jgi:outer membrane receptor protein involved in Fe transport
LKLATPPLALWVVLVGLALPLAAHAERPLLLHNPRPDAPAGKPLVVDGTLVDADQLDKVSVRFRVPGGEWRAVPMELQYGDLYRGVIPASQVVAPGVEYYVTAVTYSGEPVDVFRSADRPAHVDVQGPSRAPVAEEAPAPPEPPKPTRTSRTHRREPEPVQPPVVSTPTPAPVPVVSPPPAPRPRPVNADVDSAPMMLHRSALDEDLAVFSAGLPSRIETPVVGPVMTPTDSGVLVYDQRQIRALGARGVFDVLDVVPGLSVSRDVQGFYRVAVRGIRGAPEVLFLLDGHPLNNLYDGRALANLPVDNLDRIEVIRGPGAASYGDGAFLAVVNLVPDHSEGARLTAAGGSFGTVDGHFSGAHRFGDLELFFDGDGLRQDGYHKAITADVLSSQTLALGRDPGTPSGTTNDRRNLANVGAGMRLGGFTASARYLREDRAALVGLFDAAGGDSDLLWQVVLADLSYAKTVSDRFSFKLRAYGDGQNVDRRYQLAPNDFDTTTPADPAHSFPQGLIERVQAQSRGFGGEATAQVQLATQNALSFGAGAEQQRLSGYGLTTNFTFDGLPTAMQRPVNRDGTAIQFPAESDPAAVKRLWLSFFVDDSWQFGDRISLDVGFRLEAVQLPDPASAIGATQLSAHFNPRASLSVLALDGLRLTASYARSSRPPTVQEYAEQTPDTNFTQGQYTGNPDLAPPTVDLIELSGQLVQPIDSARIRVGATLFYEHLTQPIAAVDTSGNIVPYSNREGMRTVGGEAEARVELTRRANAWVNVSYFRLEDLDTPSGFSLLTDAPQVRFNAGLTLPIGPWLDVDVFSEYGAERRNPSRTVLEQIRRFAIPPYSVVTAQLRTERLWDHFEFALIGHNVFDVQRVDDAPRPDRITGQLPLAGVAGTLLMRAVY